ncbi:DUF2960 domain-containing protein [Pseudoalteromonas xiamenensis]|uniref:DUF2960 domain-containing protein n=1 Tax=Pseudoalteromonas xiamenensis TaxID=882626 RepID=A0A975DGZ1_9GAMM|nr:DUF2960 domain-containing protein [Pseudoalteromonas xiamenensis]QTH71598.1 DUF2960 domain-containing protein [Pseudoalteromonas xiamenensis]
MAKRIRYTYKKQQREINFAQDKYHDMFEAIAAAECVDIGDYVKMEQAVAMTSKRKAAVRNFRDEYFAKLGFSNIQFIKE